MYNGREGKTGAMMRGGTGGALIMRTRRASGSWGHTSKSAVITHGSLKSCSMERWTPWSCEESRGEEGDEGAA